MLRYLLTLLIALMLPVAPAPAQDTPTSTTNITKDDLRTHPVGAAVGDLNDRMREIGKNAEQFEKGTDSYNALKARFDDLQKQRDEAGEDIRGLRGFEVVLYGDRALGNSPGVKQAAIDFYIGNPGQRHMQPFHAYYDNNGRGPIIALAPPDPATVEGGQPPVQTILRPDDVIIVDERVIADDRQGDFEPRCADSILGQQIYENCD